MTAPAEPNESADLVEEETHVKKLAWLKVRSSWHSSAPRKGRSTRSAPPTMSPSIHAALPSPMYLDLQFAESAHGHYHPRLGTPVKWLDQLFVLFRAAFRSKQDISAHRAEHSYQLTS